MGQTINRMKEGYSKIRNEALAHAFAYMNLIEHWGSGIPRIIDKVKAAGLQEPEFIGGEVDLRINIYRGQVEVDNLNDASKVPDITDGVLDTVEIMPDTTDVVPDTAEIVPDTAEIVPDTVDTMPDTTDVVPDTVDTMPDTTDVVPDTEQKQKVYMYVLENGFITTSKVVELLAVKHRRARAVLLNMVEDGYLRKEGAARSTIYVKNTEE